MDQQHLPGNESDHSAEGLFCPLGKGALPAPGTVPDYPDIYYSTRASECLA